MIVTRFLRSFLAEISKGSYLTWHRWTSEMAYLISPCGVWGSPARRLRQLNRAQASAPPLALVSASTKGGEAGICIMVLYANRLSESTWLSIKHWSDLGFRVLVVNNSSLISADQERLRGLVWQIFERVNIGQDIGAFKDAILWLHAQGYLSQCPALAISNDSLQWIPGNNASQLHQQTLQFLAQDLQEALFSHCSYQIGHHYQSFFQVLKPSVFRSQRFLAFWQAYQPIGNRRHCIHQGEILLSKHVYNHLANVHLLYSTEALLQKLTTQLDQGQDVSADMLLSWMPSVHRTKRLKIDNPALEVMQIAAEQGRSLAASELASLADLIESNNPTHVAAFLYPLYLGCPFVKKDLCFAGSFTLGQANLLYRRILAISCASDQESLASLERLADEYAQILYNKGIPLGYQFSRRHALRKGLELGFVYAPTHILH